MNKIIKIAVGIVLFAITLHSCNSVFDVDSDQFTLPSGNKLDSPNDSIYSMVGIFSQVEKLAEKYVILGELRGDLMDITSYADKDLREVYNFDITASNKYNKVSDYYSVINNCNYLIQNIDTAIVSQGQKVMHKEFAAAKAIRAWTYMQLVLNYGKAKYYEQPILDVADGEQNFPEYSLEDLAAVLITDLSPLRDIPYPFPDMKIEGIVAKKLYFPVRMLLGDLYLWIGDYENAAREYYGLMVSQRLVTYYNANMWIVQGGEFINKLNNWKENFGSSTANYEQISLIGASYGEGKEPLMGSFFMVGNQQIKASNLAIANWKEEIYYYTNSTKNKGDLRGDGFSYYSEEYISKYYTFSGNVTPESDFIPKYDYMTTPGSNAIGIYRVGSLYLKYAEAVNRMGKPNLAFAVLKNGLGEKTLSNDILVPRHEKYISEEDKILYSYIDFEGLDFNFSDGDPLNYGIHSRGCGNIHLANSYSIPSLETLEDSINYVEDMIIKEFALETAFEGNRFQDLMRVSKHRGDNSYLAEKVAEKYMDKEAIKSKLMDENNWYLPSK